MNIGNIGSKALKYGIKGAGIAGIGICLYDAHKNGVRKSRIEVTKGNTNGGTYCLENSRNLQVPSAFNSKMKDKLFNIEITHNLRAFLNAGWGYAKGFVGMLAEDILPVGLSAAALLTKGGGMGQKIAGGALGAYAAFGFVKNVLGFGVQQSPDRDLV